MQLASWQPGQGCMQQAATMHAPAGSRVSLYDCSISNTLIACLRDSRLTKRTNCCRCWRLAYLERSCLAATAGKGELLVISTLSSALPALAAGDASDCFWHSCRAAKGCLAALRAKALCPKGGGEVASSASMESLGEGQRLSMPKLFLKLSCDEAIVQKSRCDLAD